MFNPKNIAVIGASNNDASVGYAIFENIIQSTYKGNVYPVNIKEEKIQGVKAYKTILDIDEKIDLVIIATPANTVHAIVQECGKAKVGGVVIISSGFSETGKHGESVSLAIKKTAKEYGMRILGPNCLGFIRPSIGLNASFSGGALHSGCIAFISQSGALCTSILDWANKNNVGFSYFVSIGEMTDISFHDLIDYFGKDENTTSILIYMETLKDAKKFISAARAFSFNKPIVVLKSGRTEEGAKATKSHTGSIAGNDKVFSAAFNRAGVIRVDTAVGLFHVAKLLAMQPKPLNNRLAVVTNAGGPGVIATDALVHSGGRIASLEKTTINKLNKILPPSWSKNNPVDILGDADALKFSAATELCLKDKNVDAVLVILTPQKMTNPTEVAEKITALSKKYKKTIIASWMGGNSVTEGRRTLERGNIPTYRSPEDAISSFIHVWHYTQKIELLYEKPASIPHIFNPRTAENKAIIKSAITEGRSTLNEVEAKKFLSNYDIRVIDSVVVKSGDEAQKAAQKIGFPVVMKILSPDILHKTDIDGVKLNIKSKIEAAEMFGEIMKNARSHYPDARIEGVLVSPMINKKYELIIGSKHDPIFGPVIVFGMGGVAVEVFKDFEIGLPPLNMSLAMRIIEKTKIYKLLKGHRNLPAVDIQSIQFLLYKFAYLTADFPCVKEIDINPFAIDEHGGIVLDAKVVIDKKAFQEKNNNYSHMVISPYPKEYIFTEKLKRGKSGILRPIAPEDEEMFIEMFGGISSENQKHIYFEKIKNITHNLIRRYTHIDYDREMTLILEMTLGKKKKIVGASRIIMDALGDSAEFSVVVSDKWQGLGIGGKLTDKLLTIAREKGIKKIYAHFVGKDNPVVTIFNKRGFKTGFKGANGFATINLV